MEEIIKIYVKSLCIIIREETDNGPVDLPPWDEFLEHQTKPSISKKTLYILVSIYNELNISTKVTSSFSGSDIGSLYSQSTIVKRFYDLYGSPENINFTGFNKDNPFETRFRNNTPSIVFKYMSIFLRNYARWSMEILKYTRLSYNSIKYYIFNLNLICQAKKIRLFPIRLPEVTSSQEGTTSSTDLNK
jgi:hypothetical protein